MIEMMMPAAFIGHGSPMNTLEHNRYTEAWNTFGTSVGTPRAILAISAHWYIGGTAVTAMKTPRVIHDFSGFPQELFDYDYPAPGAPDVAMEIAEIAKPAHVELDDSSWGIDHGTWSVLAHMFPKANVPVVQLSINANEPIDYHVNLGAKLAPLMAKGILILGSGNVVHNLGRIDWSATDRGYDWAERFDEATRTQMHDAPGELGHLVQHNDYALAVPTPEHFLPLAYIAGIASVVDQTPEVLVGGCELGSLSMTSFTVAN
jgi:4,5-DOPA dioxygenase extradiol